MKPRTSSLKIAPGVPEHPPTLAARPVSQARRWLAYALGVASTAVMLLLVAAGGVEVADKTPLIVFVIPIMLAAYEGGLGPGLVSTVLAVLTSIYFILPPTPTWHVSSSEDNIKWITLVLAGMLISVLSEALHRARAGAQANEARLTGIISSAMDAVVTVDEGQRIIIFNPAAEKMFGCRAADVLGQPHDLLIPERFRSAHAQHLCTYGEANITHRTMGDLGIIYGLRANGEEFPIEASISQVGAAGQKLFTVIMREITDRLRAEEMRSLLAAIVESSEDAIIGRDLNGTIVSWNPGAQRLLGYSPEEAIGRPGSMLVPPELRDEGATPLRIKRGQAVHHYETVRMRKDGERIHVAVTVSPIKDRKGRVTGVSTISRDITERKQAEALLQLRTKALEAAANGILITDRDGVIVWSNEAVTGLTGYKTDELLGRNPRLFKSGKQDAVFFQNLWQTILAGKVWKGEIINRRKNGSPYTEEMTITPVRDSGGSIAHFIAIKQDVTERKRAEEAARKSELQYRGLFEHMNEGLAYCRMIFENGEGRDFVYLAVNRTFETLTGLKQVIGKRATEVVPGIQESDPGLLEIYARVAMTGAPEKFEMFVAALGEWYSISAFSPERGFFVAIFDVITERKRAEEALRESQRRRELIARASNTGLWDWDLRTNAVYYSTEWKSQIGYAEDEISNRFEEWEQRVHPEDLAGALARVQSFVANPEGDFENEFRFRHKDGSYRWILARASVIKDEHGDACRMMGSHLDITERKRAEEEIKRLNEGLEQRVVERTAELEAVNRELEREISDRKMAEKALEELQQRTELILNSAGDGILGLDLEGKCTFANPAAQRMLGYTRDELIGQDVHLLARHRLPDGTACRPEECGVFVALRRGVVHQAEDQVLQRKDGADFPADEVATPIVEHGEIVGAVVTFRDVSERRVVEKMKNEFVSVVSHELRTPLTAIRGSLGLLAAREPAVAKSPRARRMLEIAVNNTDRLTRLINDILDAERVEAPHVLLTRGTCRAADLMQQAADLMRPLADTAGVRLEVEAQVVPLFVNRDSILQVLTNLLSNAIKFSPPRSTISFKVAVNHDVAVFKVADQGPGIPSDKLESIFGRFQQVDASDSRRRGGTGLGLSICRSIVRRHGGRIWVESELGRGSTFVFTLPLPKPGDVEGV
jgi:PAS domain S-box-containing protein